MRGLAAALVLAGGMMSCRPAEPVEALPAGRWTILGPGGGGAQMFAAISPHDPSLMFNSTDMSGCFASSDSGATWRFFILRSTCRFAFDAQRPELIYAAVGFAGLYRSVDRGRSWSLILPDPTLVAGTRSGDDEGTVYLADTKGALRPGIWAVAADPEHTGRVAASLGNELRISTDAGTSWVSGATLPGEPRHLWIAPGEPLRVFAAGPDFFGRVQASQWVALPPPSPGPLEYSAAWPPGGGPGVFWAVSREADGGLWVSRQGSAQWEHAGTGWEDLSPGGGPLPRFRTVSAAARDPNTVYVSYSGLDSGSGSGGWFGVGRSKDGGRTWRLVWKEQDGRPERNIKDPWLTPLLGPSWGENPLTIAINPSQPLQLLATDLGRTLRSVDGGEHWEGVYARLRPDGSFQSTGLDVLNVYALAFHLRRPGYVLAGATDVGPLRSEDGGRSWRLSRNGIPSSWVNTTYWIEFDPRQPDRVWAAQSGVHDLPREKMLRNRDVRQLGAGGVVCSLDAGRNWKACSTGLPVSPVTQIMRRPDGSLLAVVMGHGVFRSNDGAGHWEGDSDGLPVEGGVRLWRLHRDVIGTEYAVVVQERPTQRDPDRQKGALYRRPAGSHTWRPAALPTDLRGPTDVVTDPHNPLHIVLSAFGWDTPSTYRFMKHGGVYLSRDGGASWEQTLANDQHVTSLTLDPRRPRRILAAGFEGVLWRSDDLGMTWRAVPGFRFNRTQRVFTDPRDPDRLYLATYGASFWTGPASGDESAPQAVAGPPVLRAWPEAVPGPR